MAEHVSHDESLAGEAPGRALTVADVAMVVAVRLHEGNPWVLRRLEMLGSHYRPRPQVVLVDFGSRGAHARQLADCARRHSFEYVFEEDFGVFSLSRARNVGARRARGPLLFFSDVDCVGETDLFAQLLKLANALDMSRDIDQMLNLPVYHLGESATERIERADSPEARSELLYECFAKSAYEGFGAEVEIVDPCSNFFLCHTRFYELVGGYNEEFRGHGSEDFEFMLRFALHARTVPLPEAPLRNVYRPRREGAFGIKRYRGFRRLGEALALQAEIAGLRIAHLHHPRQTEADEWYTAGDTDKTKLREQVQPLLRGSATLCDYDWLPRERVAVALQCDERDWSLLLPLRLLGYRLRTACPGTDPLSAVRRAVEESDADTLAYVEPSLRAELPEGELEAWLAEVALETIRIERAAGPGEWRFVRAEPGGGEQAGISIFREPEKDERSEAPFPLCVRLPWGEDDPGLGRSALRRRGTYRSYAASKLAMGAQRQGQRAAEDAPASPPPPAASPAPPGGNPVSDVRAEGASGHSGPWEALWRRLWRLVRSRGERN